jgi:hypothetical protein
MRDAVLALLTWAKEERGVSATIAPPHERVKYKLSLFIKLASTLKFQSRYFSPTDKTDKKGYLDAW